MSDMSASVQFSIKYDGPALATHEMDVRELAPALLALSSLLEESNRVEFGDSVDVRVNVKGSFQCGSFQVDFAILQSITEQIVSLFSGKEASASANLLGILGGLGLLGGGTGLLSLLKWLRGRKPSKIEFKNDKAIFSIEESEVTESLEVDLIVAKLYKSRIVRQSIAKVVKPLEREGVDYFAAGRDGKPEITISKDEAEYFSVSADDAEVVSESVIESTMLQIESAVFKDGNKWRFNDGTNAFFAEIFDADFIGKIENGEERFGKGDVLLVNLQKMQTISDTGLKSEYKITKVLEHRAPLQSSLFGKPKP